MTPIFDQYLRRTALPVLELTFDEAEKTVSYRWKADERGFAMPITRRRSGEVADDSADDRLEVDGMDARARTRSRSRPTCTT